MNYEHPYIQKQAQLVLLPALGALAGAATMGLGTLIKHPFNKYIMYGNRTSPAFKEITWGRPLALGAGLGGLAGSVPLMMGASEDDGMAKTSAALPAALGAAGLGGVLRAGITAPISHGYNRYLMYGGSPNLPTMRNINWGRLLGFGAGMGALGGAGLYASGAVPEEAGLAPYVMA